jgi:hypothetical protein
MDEATANVDPKYAKSWLIIYDSFPHLYNGFDFYHADAEN